MRVALEIPLSPRLCQGPADFEYWHPFEGLAPRKALGLQALPTSSLRFEPSRPCREPLPVLQILDHYYVLGCSPPPKEKVLCDVLWVDYAVLVRRMRLVPCSSFFRLDLFSGIFQEVDGQRLPGWHSLFVSAEVARRLEALPYFGVEAPSEK